MFVLSLLRSFVWKHLLQALTFNSSNIYFHKKYGQEQKNANLYYILHKKIFTIPSNFLDICVQFVAVVRLGDFIFILCNSKGIKLLFQQFFSLVHDFCRSKCLKDNKILQRFTSTKNMNKNKKLFKKKIFNPIIHIPKK